MNGQQHPLKPEVNGEVKEEGKEEEKEEDVRSKEEDGGGDSHQEVRDDLFASDESLDAEELERLGKEMAEEEETPGLVSEKEQERQGRSFGGLSSSRRSGRRRMIPSATSAKGWASTSFQSSAIVYLSQTQAPQVQSSRSGCSTTDSTRYQRSFPSSGTSWVATGRNARDCRQRKSGTPSKTLTTRFRKPPPGCSR